MSSVSDAKDQTYELTAAHLEALSKIKTLIGPSGYITETDVMQPHVVDWRGIYKGRTELVVYPKTTQEVADIVKICAQGVMPIVPQGGNTSMCGGSVPLENSPSIVLCLSRCMSLWRPRLWPCLGKNRRSSFLYRTQAASSFALCG